MSHPSRPLRSWLAIAALATVACAHREPIPDPLPFRAPTVEGEPARRVAEQVEGLARLGYSGTLVVGTGEEPSLRVAFGWADREPPVPQAMETAHDWASVAKTLTAVTTFRLVESGALTLEDPVGRHLPEAPPDKAGITVRQLLAHTGGLATYHDLDGRSQDRTEALRRIFEADLAAEPGAGPAYSNSGYTLLAAVLEAASGRSFRELVRDEVLAKVGATASGWAGEEPDPPIARGYRDGADRGAPETASWAILGAGGMVGPATDLYRFGRALLDGEILTKESWLAMTEAATGEDDPTGGHDNALGWKTWVDDEGRRVVEKGGSSDDGFQSLLRLHPEDGLVVVALLNTRDVPYLLGKDVFVNRVVRTWRGAEPSVPPAPAPGIGIDAFEGTWVGPEGSLSIGADEIGGTNVQASGQALVDVLLVHGPDRRAAAREANARAERVIEALVRGEAGPGLALVGKGAGAAVREDLERLAAGEWAAAEILGTSAEFFRDASGLVTYVRLIDTAGEERHTRLHWDPSGRVRAVGGSAFPTPALAVLVPTGPGRAVVHHPGLGAGATVVVEGDRVVVESVSGRVTLSREGR